jgi:hypothetical protein
MKRRYAVFAGGFTLFRRASKNRILEAIELFFKNGSILCTLVLKHSIINRNRQLRTRGLLCV